MEAYLARLGLEVEAPSAEALFRLHRAHVERVPYETLWIHLGERWSADAVESFERVAATGRGGYCLHLNGAFSELLRRLGYDVDRHVGGVHGPDGPTVEALTNHLALTVRLPEGSWYVDVGLGDALHEPLPLRPGAYEQGPFRVVLEETPGGVGDWHLVHDPRGAFAGMAWRSDPVDMGAFAERHVVMSTSPESGFVRVLNLQRRDAAGVDDLRGLRLRRIAGRTNEATLGSRRELVEVLRGVFGIDVDAIGADALDGLWERTYEAHLAWEAGNQERGDAVPSA